MFMYELGNRSKHCIASRYFPHNSKRERVVMQIQHFTNLDDVDQINFEDEASEHQEVLVESKLLNDHHLAPAAAQSLTPPFSLQSSSSRQRSNLLS
jgi:hypothetical protein